MRNLQKNLRALLRERGMSQRALSLATGVSQETLVRILKHGATPRRSTLVVIANALGVAEEVLAGTSTGEMTVRHGPCSRAVPLVELPPAGSTDIVANATGEWPVHPDLWAPGRYALKITIKPLVPEIEEGDVVLVAPRNPKMSTLDYHGRTCICRLGEELLVTRPVQTWGLGGQWVTLKTSEEEACGDFTIREAGVEILGVVIGLLWRPVA